MTRGLNVGFGAPLTLQASPARFWVTVPNAVLSTTGGQVPGYTLNAGTAAFALSVQPATLLGTVPLPAPQQYKFNPGEYPMTVQYQHNTGFGGTVQYPLDFAALQSKPPPSPGNYVCGFQWGHIEKGPQVDNPTFDQTILRTQYPGIVDIETVLNALIAAFPGKPVHLGICILANTYGPTWTVSGMTSYNFGADSSLLPTYISNCGGSLTVPAAYGQVAGKITATVPPIYPGSPYYGLAFGFSPGQTVWGGAYPCFWNLAINQAFINMMQAISHYKIQSGKYAGLTFDQCEAIEFFLMNDETSYGFLNNYNPPGGVAANPPPGGSQATAIAAYKKMLAAVCAAFPHTLIANNMTYSFNFAGGPFTTNADMAGFVNDNISHTGTSLSTIRGLALSAADLYGTDWVGVSGSSGFIANAPLQGYAGASSGGAVKHVLGPFNSTSLAPSMPKISQAQPFDYDGNLPSGVASYSIAAVKSLAAAANNAFIRSTHRIWCMGDDKTFGTTAYTTYVQPALIDPTITPFATVMPTGIMVGPPLTSAVNGGTSAILTWAPITGQGTGLQVQVYRDTVPSTGAVPLAGAIGGAQAFTTYTDNTVTAGQTYAYQLGMVNSNGSGPLGPASTVAVAPHLVMYSNGVIDLTRWPANSDYSYPGGADNYKDTSNPQPGHSFALKLNASSGWQQATDWSHSPPNGVDLTAYTQMQFDVESANLTSLALFGHQTRSTGNDLSMCSSVDSIATVPGMPALTANVWNTNLVVPLCFWGMLGAPNYYKFAFQNNGGAVPTFFDNVKFLSGNTAWIFNGDPGVGGLQSGWADASTNASANYTQSPGAINANLYALNNPPKASAFTASLVGGLLTITGAITGAPIAIGSRLVNFSGPTVWGTITGGSGNSWTVSGSLGNFNNQSCATAWLGSDVQILSLGVTSNGGLWRANFAAGFNLTPYANFTFGAIPTKTGNKYVVQCYTTAGVATGTPITINSDLTYTPADRGLDSGAGSPKYTVYSIPLSALGVSGATIGGISIKDNSGNATNTIYLSAIGFWS